MDFGFIVKYFRKETKFGLKIGQSHKADARKWVSWCLLSRSRQIFEILGHGDLSAADIQRISDNISEDEMFIYGSFEKKPKVMGLNAIITTLPLDEAGLQGIITKRKIYQVTGERGEFEYPFDKDQVKDCCDGKLDRSHVKMVKMTNLSIDEARKIFWEFVNS